MKKHVKDFLNYLEKETSINIDLSTFLPTQKVYNSNNRPVLINVVAINDYAFGLSVLCCGVRGCKNIIGVEILYDVNDDELSDAQIVQEQIKSAVPSIRVGLRNVTED